MPRIKKKKTRAEGLTRVRNNQCRCRQRQRDCVADLERRIVSLENTTAREISTLQSMTDVLRQESEQLKAFVDASLGVEDTDMVPSTHVSGLAWAKYNDADTTVWTVALELVIGYNTKNLSISELDLRLRGGYRCARFLWEGCRMANQVLFAVFAEVIE
ncbi:uncharacterized protein BO72DRAFT_506511 [Aspergillus fijiensis CBS 313.89]|uniref:Uncharacterized protein n=1 Tax=Aspergillus fijiensis CBS 313.89 TaxID=1448319 RepID=A0A8G1RW44_9EURO|nr:uncharacterized protein BO72DRAFT_506511 [Aspergillus fijiensis CBS 313.89]RAK78880.1 hypothetical protein BO72DRAFT_506511 [Aspergillus fijiensis CBS 313.89]